MGRGPRQTVPGIAGQRTSRFTAPIAVFLSLLSGVARAQNGTESPFAPGGPLEPWSGGDQPHAHQANAPRLSPELAALFERKFTHSAIWLEGHAGLGAPIGNVGVALDLQPVQFLAVTVGTGRSFDGAQYMIAPRARLRFWPFPTLTFPRTITYFPTPRASAHPM